MIITPLFIIFICIVFALVWLFVKIIDKRWWVTLIISLIVTPIAYFYVVYPFLNIICSYHHVKTFNANAWQSKPELRYEMSNAIISENILKGKSTNEVKALLGASEWFGWDANLKANTPLKWNYNLGFKPGAFNHKQECLEVNFKNDTVIGIKQYQLIKEFE